MFAKDVVGGGRGGADVGYVECYFGGGEGHGWHDEVRQTVERVGAFGPVTNSC